MWGSTIGGISPLTLSLLTAPLPSQAQHAAHVPRLGLRGPGSASAFVSRIEAFRHGRRALGYVEGHTVPLASRWAGGPADRLPALVAEVVRLPVDVLAGDGAIAMRAAQQATTTRPTVMAVRSDPVGAGLVASLARPGGTGTGRAGLAPAFSGHRLEMLKAAVPTRSRVATLWHRGAPVAPVWLKEPQAAAQALGLQLHAWEVRGPDGCAQAFAAMPRAHAEALVGLPSALFSSHSRGLAEPAGRHRWPSMDEVREHVDAGGLLSCGPSRADQYRRAAGYGPKIRTGVKPADLPVEQPVRFESVIDLKTAQARGLTIPTTRLFQADEVIQEACAGEERGRGNVPEGA